MMKLSILITSYNLEEYISQAIESVVKQNMPFEWELLIGDDGSTDGTVDIIKQWIEKYPQNIKLVVDEHPEHHSKNGTRAAKNRARLLEKANGDYIHFLDGDDAFVYENKLKNQVDILENPEFADCSCTGHNIIRALVNEGREELYSAELPNSRRILKTEIARGRYVHTDTIMFRKECKVLLLDPLYRDYLNDTFITYILMQYGSMYYVNQAWSKYNITGEGLWTGRHKVYGYFRNVIIYDLKIHVNRSLKKELEYQHLFDIRFILKNYKIEGEHESNILVDNLDTDIFSTTWLLYRINNLTFGEKFKREAFKLYIYTKATVRRIKNLFNKILSK